MLAGLMYYTQIMLLEDLQVQCYESLLWSHFQLMKQHQQHVC